MDTSNRLMLDNSHISLRMADGVFSAMPRFDVPIAPSVSPGTSIETMPGGCDSETRQAFRPKRV